MSVAFLYGKNHPRKAKKIEKKSEEKLNRKYKPEQMFAVFRGISMFFILKDIMLCKQIKKMDNYAHLE